MIEPAAERLLTKVDNQYSLVVLAARRARQIVDAAESDSRRMRHETEDFCDQRLASFEIVLDKVLRAVQIGRERLNPNLTDHRNAPDADDKKAVDAFFDQDRG